MMEKEESKQKQYQLKQINRPQFLYRRGDFDTFDNTNNGSSTDSSNSIINGRHLLANDTIEKGQIVFVERPMVCIQSLENLAIQNVKICRHCKSFLDISTSTTATGTTPTRTTTALDNNSISTTTTTKSIPGEYALQSFCQTATTMFDDNNDDNESHQQQQQNDDDDDDNNNNYDKGGDDDIDKNDTRNNNKVESTTINEIEKLRSKFLQTMSTDTTNNKLQSNTNVSDNDNNNNLCINAIIPCRYNCGYMYCSTECEQDSWESYHWCLCTGLVSDDSDSDDENDNGNDNTKIPVEEHPLIKFKQYAVQTNEILLLVAEWWVAEYMYKKYYNDYNNNNDENNPSTSVPNDAEKKNQQQQQVSPYQDYLMNTWWDAVALDMKSQQLLNTENNNNKLDNWIVERNSSTTNNNNNKIITQTIDDIEESIHRICYDGAILLNDALSLMSNNTIPSINAYDISIRIGSCEQNSMGIRQRHPLCRTIILQQQLRQHYHTHFVNFLYSNGIFEINNTTATKSNHHDNNNDNSKDDKSNTIQIQQQQQDEDDNTDEINNNTQTDCSTVDIDKDDNPKSKSCVAAAPAAAATDDDNDNKNYTSTQISLHEQYTVDDIANELSKLDFLEWNHLRNIANELRDDKISNDNDNKNSTIGTTSTKVSQHGYNSNVQDEKKYDNNDNDNNEEDSTVHDDNDDNDNEEPGDGDDYDYLFPPIDGTAMYSIACKMNHSCVPNIIILYNPRIGWSKYHPLVAIAVALQPLCKNDEMTISYIDLNQSYEQRQAALANYGFTCTCPRCIKEKAEIDNKCTLIENQQQPSKDEIQDPIESDLDDNENENDPSNGYEQNAAGHDGGDGDDESIDDVDQYEREYEQQNRNENSVSSAQKSKNCGEERLQQLIDTADTKWNQSMYGTIPEKVMGPISSFIVQCGTATLAKLQQPVLPLQSNNSNHNTTNQITTIIKFLQRCIDAIEHRDYSMCKIVGTDLSQILVNTVQTNHNCWFDISYRFTYWCSTIVAAIGYSKDWNFLVALQYIDQSIITGVLMGDDDDNDNSDKQLLLPLLYYIEQFADQMYTVPYPPSCRCTVPQYSIAKSLDMLTNGLSQPILYPIMEATTNEIPLDSSVYSVLSPIVIRNFAMSWPAITKWRHLHTFAHTFGHRLIPIEIGSKMATTTTTAAMSSDNNNNVNENATTTTKIVSFRSFIEQFLVPSTNHGIWTLQDAVEKSKRLKYKESTVSYLSQEHPLLSQVSMLQNDIVMILPSLFTTTGTSPTPDGNSCTNDNDQQQQPPQQLDVTIAKHVNVSMGTGGTRTPLHSKNYDIVVVQIVGVQYVRMYTPDQTLKLYVDNVYNDNGSSTTKSSLESSISTSYNYHQQLQGTTNGSSTTIVSTSTINCEIENYKEQLLCENAIYTETILYPGDCLYIPSQTLYYVRSLTTSISINYCL